MWRPTVISRLRVSLTSPATWSHGAKTWTASGRLEESNKPVIRFPVPLQKKRLKKSSKILFGRMDRFEGERDKPVILCRRSELNHYYRQTYSKVDTIPLASQHWQSRRTHGDFFTFTAWSSAKHRTEEVSGVKFSHLDLDPRLVEALESCGFRRPTLIQARAIPELLGESSSLVASETGNGKTLAFLVPLLQQALNLKVATPPESRPFNAPFGMVITPGRELAKQIFSVAQDLALSLGLKVRLELGGRNKAKVIAGEREEIDLLVGTFGAVNVLVREGYYSKNCLRHVALDEADTLLDDTFNEDTVPFLGHLRYEGSTSKRRKDSLQVTFVAATFPTNFKNILSDVLDADELHKVSTSRLHLVLPHVRQTFVRCRRVGKEDYLMHYLAPDVAKGKQAVVFSNKSGTSNFVAHFLRQEGIEAVAFNSKLDHRQREENLMRFLHGEAKVLSCTDLASRGLDTSNAHHIINYDFPLNMSDYVHRAGRTGRVGSPNGCKVTSLVGGKIQVHLVQMLEEAVRTRREIPNVNNNIIRIIRHKDAKNKAKKEEQEEEESERRTRLSEL